MNEENSVTTFETLYESVLSKLVDFELGEMEPDDVCETLRNYIRPALVDYHLRRPEIDNIDWDSNVFNCALSMEEIEIISDLMLVKYIDSNYIRTSEILRLTLSSSEFHLYSPANHLKEVRQMRDEYKKEAERLMARLSYFNRKKKAQEDE